MKKRRFQGLIAMIMFSMNFFFIQGQEKLPEKLLPASSRDGQWKKQGRMDMYFGDDLYIYINGGAEIFHEYGFRQVVVQDYVHTSGKTLTLELYVMDDDSAAFGMYSFKRGDTGEDVAVGSGGRQDGYYLNFWKGPYLITLTGFDEDDVTVKGVRDVAYSVAGEMTSIPEGRIPPLVECLPEKGLMRQTIRFLKGHLGLFNSYPFFNKDVFKTTRAVVGAYEEGYRIFLIPAPAAEPCSSILGEAAVTIEKESRYAEVKKEKEGWRLLDRDGRSIRLRCIHSFIVAVVAEHGFEGADAVFSWVKNKLSEDMKARDRWN